MNRSDVARVPVSRSLLVRDRHISRALKTHRVTLRRVRSSKKARQGGACGRLREECLPLPLRCVTAAIHHVGIAERLEQRLGLASAAARSSVEHDRRCLVGRQEGNWHGRIGVPVPNDGVGRSRMLRALVWPAKVDHNGPRSDAANILWRGQNGRRRRR